MVVAHATMEDAVANGIDLSSNAFMLIHGWTAGPLLLQFVGKFLKPLMKQAMTAEQLASETNAEKGPLAIMLRTCIILKYLDFDAATRAYSVVGGLELDELDTYLRPTSPTARALQGIYAKAIPPFSIPSEEATHCLVVWAEHRPTWLNSKSKGLSILLDGIVLAPLLTSITYFARWNEDGLDLGKENAMERFDFSKVDPVSQTALGDIFEELGVGTMNAKGIITMSSKGSLALQRCYSYFVPTSYSPMLAEFNTILFDDPGWGFVDAGQDAQETEIHVERTLNVVGSGAQHQTLFKDLMRHINVVFGGEDFQSQPQFVVDTGSGDGHLLMHVYDHVKEHTARGKVLSEYPLTMVGIDFNEESRVATAVNLTKRSIPHIVLFGDIGRPAAIMTALKKKKVDLSKTLHVRSFLDHDRPYIPPVHELEEGSPAAVYAMAQMADFVHLDKHGNPITALEVFASLVEHFGRWGDALQGSFGLCMLEVMMLDVPTTQHFLNDCVSFHFDIVQCLSRQYMISPAAFAMGAAMAGLLPANYKAVQTYPEEARYCRVLNQHLVRRPFKVRFADMADLPSLVHLEELAWAESLRATPDVLRRRLETSPTTNLVCEMKGKVVAVLYMQLINSLDAVDKEQFMEISNAHSPKGRIMQLIAISTHPEVSSIGIGADLKGFALHLARLDQNIDTVIGITRCRDFISYDGTMQEYVDAHVAGKVLDPTLDFHTGYGAQVVRLVPGFRPEDVDNHGTGVLIQYHVKELAQKTQLRLDEPKRPTLVPTLEVISQIMDELGYPLDKDDLAKGFFDYGMDSLELVRVRNKLSSTLDMDLPATLLLDFPTVKDLAVQLDRELGVGAEEGKSEGSSSEKAQLVGWDTIGVTELMEIQDRCKKMFSLPQYQKRFTDIARMCYPDTFMYTLAIEPIIVEVEGSAIFDFGLIEDTQWSTVQKNRGEMTKCILKYWGLFSEVRALGNEVFHLTKQDQQW